MGASDTQVGTAIAVATQAEYVANAEDAQHSPVNARKSLARAMPKWESDARERLKTGIRRFARPLADLRERDANEGDTRLLVTDFLCEALGYDKYSDLTTEYLVRGEFADYGVRLDKQMIAFIEVKRIATVLGAKHLRQVEMYAVNEGVEWLILTSGANWRAYHLTGGLPVQIDLALDVDLLGDESPQRKVDQLFYLTREAMKRRLIDEVWKARRAMSPKSLTAVLLSDTVIGAVQKELRRQTGHAADAKEIGTLLRSTVLRTECLER